MDAVGHRVPRPPRIGHAHVHRPVRLEEHTSSALGNPCAMITTRSPGRWRTRAASWTTWTTAASRTSTPRSTPRRLLPLPRGQPPHRAEQLLRDRRRRQRGPFIVADLIEDRAAEPVTVTNEIVYSVVPKKLLLRYITDETLRRHVKQVMLGHRPPAALPGRGTQAPRLRPGREGQPREEVPHVLPAAHRERLLRPCLQPATALEGPVEAGAHGCHDPTPRSKP